MAGAMSNGTGENWEVSRLLRDTDCSQWQQALRKLLGGYLMHEAVTKAINFLTDTIQAATRALRNPTAFPGFPAICVPMDRKPAVFSLDLWKHILIGLHLDITEPESNRHLDLLEVSVTAKVHEEALRGFLALLNLLQALDWPTFRTVIAMEDQSALPLLHTLERVRRSSNGSVPDEETITNLLERYPEFMSSLGFQKNRRRRKETNQDKASEHCRKYSLVWEDPGTTLPLSVELVLIGLFQNGDNVELFV